MAETAHAAERAPRAAERATAAFIASRLRALRAFFAAVDAGIGAFAQGEAFAPETVQKVVRMMPRTTERR